MPIGGGSGGITKITDASDISLSAPSEGESLVINAFGDFENQLLITYDALDQETQQRNAADDVLRSQSLAVNVYDGSEYPPRPSGFASVEWRGPIDPGSAAFEYDTWLDTA